MTAPLHAVQSGWPVAVLAVCALFSVVGCRLELPILSATSSGVGGEALITVTIRARDAKSIKTRQLYTWLVVVDCAGGPERFPAEPSIGGEPVSSFRFPLSSNSVDLVARVPARIYAQYPHPCAVLEGGGYFTGKIQSSSLPIRRAQGAGPNHSFKPTPRVASA